MEKGSIGGRFRSGVPFLLRVEEELAERREKKDFLSGGEGWRALLVMGLLSWDWCYNGGAMAG